MFLIKILGNNKTANLNVEIRYKNMVDVMSNPKKMDEIISTIEYINEPITMNLSSLLQLCCQFTLKADSVKYLLELGGDPNYLDVNGCSCYTYVDDNDEASDELKAEIKELLNQYKDFYSTEDKKQRKLLGWDFMYIAKDEYCKNMELKTLNNILQ